MAKHNTPILILKLKLAGEPQYRLRAVTRLKLDGRGRILYWDAETGEIAAVDVAELESVSIQRLKHISKAA